MKFFFFLWESMEIWNITSLVSWFTRPVSFQHELKIISFNLNPLSNSPILSALVLRLSDMSDGVNYCILQCIAQWHTSMHFLSAILCLYRSLFCSWILLYWIVFRWWWLWFHLGCLHYLEGSWHLLEPSHHSLCLPCYAFHSSCFPIWLLRFCVIS